MLEVLLESLLDTLKAVPILYLVYLFVAFFSHKSLLKASQKNGPLIGAALGQIPQCGFSSAMADLYSKKHITIGTLLAVLLATSDEALPVLLSNPQNILTVLLMVAIKFVFAVIVGYSIDKIFNKKQAAKENVKINVKCNHCGVETAHHENSNEQVLCNNPACVKDMFIHALKHTLIISLYLLIASVAINLLIYFVGLEVISTILVSNSIFQPFLVAVLGLIPSCAVSVTFVELFLSGVLSFGSLIAGLSAGAGLGLVVLFAKNKNIKNNILILAMLYYFSVLLGMIVNIFEMLIF